MQRFYFRTQRTVKGTVAAGGAGAAEDRLGPVLLLLRGATVCVGGAVMGACGAVAAAAAAAETGSRASCLFGRHHHPPSRLAGRARSTHHTHTHTPHAPINCLALMLRTRAVRLATGRGAGRCQLRPQHTGLRPRTVNHTLLLFRHAPTATGADHHPSMTFSSSPLLLLLPPPSSPTIAYRRRGKTVAPGDGRMSAYLPPNLLQLFKPGPPLEYLRPVEPPSHERFVVGVGG